MASAVGLDGRDMTVVCELFNGIHTTYAFLCEHHQEKRLANRWAVKVTDAWTMDHGCDDCVTMDQQNPAYATPTVAYVPTTPDAFVPAPGWTADKAPETWPARLERLRKENAR